MPGGMVGADPNTPPSTGGGIGGGMGTSAGMGGPSNSFNQAAGGIGDFFNNLGDKIGNPGHNNFNATPYATDPGAFQGGWNDPNNPFSTGNMAAGAAGAQQHQAPGLQNQYGAGGFNAAQQGQGALAGMLMNTANGTAPSLANAQMQAGQQTNAANTMALQAQARGVNPSMSAYNAGQINSQANQATNQQGAIAGLAERQGAQNMLGNVLSQQGQLGGQMAQAGAQNQLQQQAQNNQLTQYYTSQGMSQEQAQLQANIAMQQINSQNYNAAQGLNADVWSQNANQSGKNIGSIVGGIANIGGSVASALGMADGGVIPDRRGTWTGVGLDAPGLPDTSSGPTPGTANLSSHLSPPGFHSGPGGLGSELGDYPYGTGDALANAQGSYPQPTSDQILAHHLSNEPALARALMAPGAKAPGMPAIDGAGLRAAGGTVAPGMSETRKDSVVTTLRPGEAVVPPEMPEYDAVVEAIRRHHARQAAGGR